MEVDKLNQSQNILALLIRTQSIYTKGFEIWLKKLKLNFWSEIFEILKA